MALRRDTPVQFLKGVGPKLGDLFARKGLKTVGDLFEFYPRSYEDRRAARHIASLRPGDIVSLKAQVASVHSVNMGHSTRKMYDVVLQDASGKIHCKYFRVPYRGYFERFTPFKEVRVVGKVIEYRGRIEFHHPDLRDIEPDEEVGDDLIPLYTEIEGLSTVKIQKLIQLAFAQMKPEDWGPEVLPAWLREKYQLLDRKIALTKIHRPEADRTREYMEYKSEAHRRIIFEEFYWLELYLATKKAGFKKEITEPILNAGTWAERLVNSLPFTLTGAQQRAFAEIRKDMEAGHPMHRLVQGDVGSGKTLVSFLATLTVAESGFQSCLMAPTEILSEQHFKGAVKFLEPLGIRVAVLTGHTKASARKKILQELADG